VFDRIPALSSLFALCAFVLTLLPGMAHAAGSATPPPPAPPQVDWSDLPDSARFRPMNKPDEPHQVELRLITDRTAAAPGETFRLGLWLEQDEGWHTYWRYNNDVGLPTLIDWSVPQGATTTDYVYPVPQRFDLEGIVSYGYDDQVLLFTQVTLPDDLPEGPITLAAEASWLTCEVQCIPGQGRVELPFTVGSGGEPSVYAPLFDHFEAQHPLTADEAGELVRISSSFEPEGGFTPDGTWTATFTVSPVGDAVLGAHEPLGDDSWPTLVPQADKDMLWLEPVTVQAQDDGSLQITLTGESFAVDEPRPIPLGGLFQLKVGDQWVRTEATVEGTWAAGSGAAPAQAPSDDGDGAEAALAATGDPLVDDPTCSTMKAGLGNAPAEESGGGVLNMLLMLGFAFLGGLILNIMPCVLPVLTLKIYGLVEQKTDSTKDRITEGVAYTAGIVFSFLALAGVLIGLQAATGMQAGWGFMMQNPTYVGVLGVIVFAFGLSMVGVFEIPVIGGNAASQASYKEGIAGYFFTGVFAVLLATPCSAPFLGPAMGFAFSQPPALLALFMVMVGLGLASPFLLVAFVPAFYKIMPQPGPWMDTFKQIMGFTLFATAVWLIYVLAGQVSQDALLGYLAFFVFVGLGAWVFGHFGGLAASMGRQLGALGAAIAVMLVGGYLFVDAPMFLGLSDEGVVAKKDVETDDGIPWRILTQERSAHLLARYREGQDDGEFAGKAVFIDFTADWCLSCKANEKTFIDTQVVEDAMRDLDVVAVKADWTRRDDMIGSWLSCYETAGVPYYLVLPADPQKPAIQIGETLTSTDDLVQAFREATGEAGS